MRGLTWDAVLGRRLARSHLLERAPRSRVAAVVADVCGLQAQVLAAAELGIAARVADVTQADVKEELWERRRLVKTFALRGTLHLLASDELGLWMAARRAAVANGGNWYEAWGLEPGRAKATIAAISDALDGRALTRDELAAEVGGQLGRWAKKRLSSAWGELVSLPMTAGAVCFGPNEGSKVTFVRTDQWLGEVADVEPDEALREVLRRYLTTYGPARPRDFAEWFSPTKKLRAAEVERLLAEMGDEVEEVDVDGSRGWILAADAKDGWEPAPGSLRLLPQYDCYFMGSRFGRERVFPEEVRTRAPIKFEGPVQLSWVVAGGAAVGYWERKRQGKRVALRIVLFRKLKRAQRRTLDAEVERVGAFLGADPDVTVEEG